jgi:hypothetical protein
LKASHAFKIENENKNKIKKITFLLKKIKVAKENDKKK